MSRAADGHAESAENAESASATLRALRVSQGAEAVIEPTDHFGLPVFAKRRRAKPYRDARLDARLRDARTRDEANLLMAARIAGVPVPVVYDADRAGAVVLVEPIAGRTLREVLAEDRDPVAVARVRTLGRLLRRLHDAGMTHGDPTTSNVLVPDAADPASLVLIDFGLGSFTEEPEERGVDLHLVEEAFEATDARAAALVDAFLEAYGNQGSAAAARRRLEAIRERGRYR